MHIYDYEIASRPAQTKSAGRDLIPSHSKVDRGIGAKGQRYCWRGFCPGPIKWPFYFPPPAPTSPLPQDVIGWATLEHKGTITINARRHDDISLICDIAPGQDACSSPARRISSNVMNRIWCFKIAWCHNHTVQRLHTDTKQTRTKDSKWLRYKLGCDTISPPCDSHFMVVLVKVLKLVKLV